MSELAALEIRALVRIMDELTYYQLFHVEADCSARDLKQAYYTCSRTFHPDANRNLEPELLRHCHLISKRITEAYCVLRDPRKRKVYDEKLTSGSGVRMQLAEAKAAQDKSKSEKRVAKTPQGIQFLNKAEDDIRRADFSAAVRNLQMALTFEPNNPHLQEMLESARKQRS